MKKTNLTLLLIFNISLLFAQLDDTSSTNNGAMIFGDGTGTLYQFAGDQRGTDTTNQSQGGFGILSGSHQISPIVWMYGNTNRNAFQVRKKGYNSTVQNGSTLFHVGATGNVGIGTTTPSEKLHVNGNILSNKLMLNDPNRTIDWNTIWQSGFYESYNATNGPESGGWFWGLNMNHVSNSSTYKYNGQIAIKNSSSSPTMYFRSTNRLGAGTWAKIITDIGNKVIITGNVGIGTTNPQYKLHVNSGVQLRKTSIGATSASSENSWIRDDWLTGSYGPPKWNQATAKWVRPGGTYNDVGGVIFQDEGTYFIRDNRGTQLEYTNNEFLEKAYLFAHISTGNIGIGTNNPSEKLHVNGLIRINKATSVDNNSPGLILASNDDFLYDGQYINHYGFGFHGYQDGTTTFVEPSNSYVSGYFGIDFFSSGKNRMRISRDGIVSIGTVERPTGYKLAVAGNIISEEVKVKLQSSGWPDFVFEKDYPLPSLKSVEQHINLHGHLKDIPSSKEVVNNGILLGSMNAKLLQKIEELTLYTIQQQKELEAQHQKNKSLEARLEALEVHLKN